MNGNKSVILRSGSLKHSNEKYGTNEKLTWTSDSSSTLGIVFSNDKNKYHEFNLIPKVKDFCNCLNRWKKHNLSLIGKIAVIKTFALPKLVYPLTVLENPNAEILNTINKAMFDFLWDNKPDKINRKTIIQDYENGGLKMIDLNLFIKAIKAGWVKRITNNDNDGDWKHIYMNILKTVGGCLVFESNLNERDFYKEQRNFNSTFLFEIVQAWSHINFNSNPKIIKKQIIWNNSFIKNDNKTLFYKYWFDKGIKYIEQLFDIRHKTF